MATIVRTTDEDPVLTVVRQTAELAWADGGPEVAEPQVNRLCMEAQECMVNSRWLELASLALTSADLVFPKMSDKDLECAFTLICEVAKRVSSPNEELEIAKLVSSKMTHQPNDKATLRLKILVNLYNLLTDPQSRFYVFMKILELASNGKSTESILPSFKKIDSFLQEWNIGKLEQRNLFLSILNILKDNKSMARDYFRFLCKYLATFSIEESDAISKAKEEAALAIIEFVKSPDIFQCDLLDMPAVVQLEKDEKYALVYQLLKIFLTQRLDTYLDFYSTNSHLLTSYGLVHEDCVTKMRLMSLVDLSSNGSNEIPYSVIKDTLQINDDEVEYWVTNAIIAKVLDCKMDQMNQLVIVSRHIERVFWEASMVCSSFKAGEMED